MKPTDSLLYSATLIGESLMNVSIAIVVVWAVQNGESFVGRVLNSRPLVYVGGLSYSLYLWQQLFVNRTSSARVSSFPLNVVLAIVSHSRVTTESRDHFWG